jgi:hypothetical protein
LPTLGIVTLSSGMGTRLFASPQTLHGGWLPGFGGRGGSTMEMRASKNEQE